MKRLSWMTDQEWQDFKTKGLSCPVAEEKGKIRMRNLATGEYEFLSQESANAYRGIKKQREEDKKWNSPKEIYRRWRSNDRFWDKYAICIRETALLDTLKRSKDPRLEQILNVRNGARELYKIEHPQDMSTQVQIAGARAILAYVETEHPDLYQYIQTTCKWLDRGIRAEDRIGVNRRIT
jgi:hypothetical protein